MEEQTVAELMVRCLEEAGVEYIFGIPGEENTDFIEALAKRDKIRFILTRHEQGASFMADIYGRLTNKAGVCLATLGPGAINLLLGTADAQLDGSPLVALAAQASLDRLNKESHQVIDLLTLFSPVTKWRAQITQPQSVNEIVAKGFKAAETLRFGAVALILPEDVAKLKTSCQPIKPYLPHLTVPEDQMIAQAAQVINEGKKVVILAGSMVFREHAESALTRFVNKTQIPVATTFMAKGVIAADHPLYIGTIGFMRHDYANFGFDEADVIIALGYDLVEYSPKSWNPHGDKKIIHIHPMPAEVDVDYGLTVGVMGNMNLTLERLAEQVKPRDHLTKTAQELQLLLAKELTDHENDESYPLKPQRIVGDLRKAMAEEDIALCDTGALKMWMARLFPCYHPNTCIISNSLATMGFSLPGALAAKLVYPERRVVAVMGDGSFMMNSQEIETAKRENIPFVILIWRDSAYGLIKWKQELEYDESHHVNFTNPDFVDYAKSFGIKAYTVNAAEELLPILKAALAANELVLVDCPVDYSENKRLTDMLGSLSSGI